MKKIIIAAAAAIMAAISGLSAQTPEPSSTLPAADFNFVVVNEMGKVPLFSEMMRELPPETEVHLVLYDPDCNECHALLDSLAAPGPLADAVEEGTSKVYVVAPMADSSENTVLNLVMMMNGDVVRYPSKWKFGVDGTTIMENDSFTWDVLPLYLKFKAGDYVGIPAK